MNETVARRFDAQEAVNATHSKRGVIRAGECVGTVIQNASKRRGKKSILGIHIRNKGLALNSESGTQGSEPTTFQSLAQEIKELTLQDLIWKANFQG